MFRFSSVYIRDILKMWRRFDYRRLDKWQKTLIRSSQIYHLPFGMRYFPYIIFVAIIAACGRTSTEDVPVPEPSNPNATTQARALFQNLERVRQEQVLFGQQDALAYGVKWFDEPDRSDVKDITGSHPAVHGWELGGIERGGTHNFDGISFSRMQDLIRQGYERGAVITVSWHMDNPATDGDAWDVTDEHRVVAAILPGGEHHDIFTSWLDVAAEFFSGLQATDDEGNTYLIPLIFRPWHEMNGHWFWWGAPFSSDEEFRQLYRFTVEYLRDEKGLHNLLWAYSPNSLGEFEHKDEYWRWYPGDDWVDVLGFDDYYTTWGGYGDADGVGRMTEYLVWLVEQAEARGKIPALTETGQAEMLTDLEWYTAQLLASIEGHPTARRIAWVLVWRNANELTNRRDHFYVPDPGHPAEDDFRRFAEHPLIWLEDDLPDM
jgi:mannan endo-1,4-beta-mannosidase